MSINPNFFPLPTFITGQSGPISTTAKGAYGRNARLNEASAMHKHQFILGTQYSNSTDPSTLKQNLLGFAAENYAMLDTNGDGKVDFSEYIGNNPQTQLSFPALLHAFQTFNNADLNGDGQIDLGEMAALIAAKDKNQDGTIDFQEKSSPVTKAQIQAVYDQQNLGQAATDFLKPETLSAADTTTWVDSTYANSKDILKADQNGDNAVSKEEFTATHHKLPSNIVDDYFNLADLDGDGKVSVAEDAAFTLAADKDHSGLFSASEVSALASQSDAKQQVQKMMDTYKLNDRMKADGLAPVSDGTSTSGTPTTGGFDINSFIQLLLKLFSGQGATS